MSDYNLYVNSNKKWGIVRNIFVFKTQQERLKFTSQEYQKNELAMRLKNLNEFYLQKLSLGYFNAFFFKDTEKFIKTL